MTRNLKILQVLEVLLMLHDVVEDDGCALLFEEAVREDHLRRVRVLGKRNQQLRRFGVVVVLPFWIRIEDEVDRAIGRGLLGEGLVEQLQRFNGETGECDDSRVVQSVVREAVSLCKIALHDLNVS